MRGVTFRQTSLQKFTPHEYQFGNLRNMLVTNLNAVGSSQIMDINFNVRTTKANNSLLITVPN